MSITTSTEPEQAEAGTAPDAPPAANSRRRWVIFGVGAAVVLAAGAGVLFASPVLDVKQVEVTGNSGIPAEQVVSASGITQGAPLLWVNTSSAAERVAQLDAVASATVNRKWPNAVVIEVVPETAVAYTPTGDQWDVWGAGGNRVAVVTEVPADLPELRDVPEQSRAEALAVAGSLPASVRTQVGAVSLQEGRGYLLELKDGAGTVRWGDANESNLKATVLAAMMAAAPDAKWFDVSSPTAPRSAVAEPARVPRNGAAPTPTPSPTATDAEQPAGEVPATDVEPTVTEQPAPPVDGGGEAPIGLRDQ